MDNELKPCPFCGGEAEFINNGFYYAIRCKDPNCYAGAVDVKDFDLKRLIAAWNQRAERTCKDLKEFPHLFTCSACGETEYEGLRPNYCPECGARVEGD